MERELAQVGECCPYEACTAYGQRNVGNIVRNGKTRGGVQRYRCQACGRTFTATRGTLFYRKQRSRQDILETLVLLAEGVRISSIARAKGIKADIILNWLRQAAHHAEQVESVLMADYQVSRAQVDALWAYVRHKGQKGAMPKASKSASSGGAP